MSLKIMISNDHVIFFRQKCKFQNHNLKKLGNHWVCKSKEHLFKRRCLLATAGSWAETMFYHVLPRFIMNIRNLSRACKFVPRIQKGWPKELRNGGCWSYRAVPEKFSAVFPALNWASFVSFNFRTSTDFLPPPSPGLGLNCASTTSAGVKAALVASKSQVVCHPKVIDGESHVYKIIVKSWI